MKPNREPHGTPRSAAGFAIALTLAAVTFWASGLVFELRGFHADAVPVAGAMAVQCASGDDVPPCVPPAFDP